MISFKEIADSRKNSPLLRACLSRNLPAVRQALQNGANPSFIFSEQSYSKIVRDSPTPNEFEHDFDIFQDFDHVELPNIDAILNRRNPRRHGYNNFFVNQTNLPRCCICHAATLPDLSLFNLLLEHRAPTGHILYELLNYSVLNNQNELASLLSNLDWVKVADGELLRNIIKCGSLPLLDQFFSYDEDYSPINDLIIESSIEKQSTAVIELFRKKGHKLSISTRQWQDAIAIGSAQFIRELFLHQPAGSEIEDKLIASAIESENIESLSILVGVGLGQLKSFTGWQISAKKNTPIHTYISLLEMIIKVQGESTDAWKDQILILLGQSKEQINSKVINVKDLNKFDKCNSFRETPFARVALRAAFIASTVAGSDLPVAKSILSSLLRADLKRISSTQGLSWARYARSIDQESLQPSHLEDVFRDIADAFLLPKWAVEIKDDQLSEEQINRKRPELEPFAGVLFLEDKDTLSATLLSRRWLRQVDRIVAEYRGAKAGIEWEELFKPVQLPSGMRIICLTSTEQLVHEGRMLKHCVGSGGYASGCAKGLRHIISIRDKNHTSLATIELASSDSGNISLGRHGMARVRQFFGYRNSTPPKDAKHAWEQFLNLFMSGNVEISKNIGATAESKKILENQKFLKTFGFFPEETSRVLNSMFDRYQELSHQSKSNYECQFLSSSIRPNLVI